MSRVPERDPCLEVPVGWHLRLLILCWTLCLSFSQAASAENDSASLRNPTEMVAAQAAAPVTPSVRLNHPVAILPAAEHGRPKIALALGGGGTRAAAEIGVLRVLERNGIPIDAIAGSSMGSLIGGLYLAGTSLDDLQATFEDRSLMKSFNSIPPYLRIAALPYRSVKRALGHTSFEGLYKGNVFRNFLTRRFVESHQNIENLKRPFAAIAFNLLDGATYAIRSGDLGDALQASCAIPVLRKPVPIGDKLFVDGGSIDNVPVDEAHALGGDLVIAVNVDETINQVPPETFYKVGTVGARMLNLELAIADAKHCQSADIVIHPNVNGIGITSTRRADAMRAIAAGEESAEQALPAIREKLKEAGIVCKPSADVPN